MWKLAVLLGFTHAVKFKRCLWDELIFSRYAFNDDDKKVPGRLGSFFWGPVRPVVLNQWDHEKTQGPNKKKPACRTGMCA